MLKREISEVRRAVLPAARADAEVLRGPGVRRGARGRAVLPRRLDHLNQDAEVVDGLDSLLSTAFDAHLARITVQQNDDMRKISAGVALIAVPTLIAGVYGMNFDHMPELRLGAGLPVRAGADGRSLSARCGRCSRSPAGSRRHGSGGGSSTPVPSRTSSSTPRATRYGTNHRSSGSPRTAAARRSRRRRPRTPRRCRRSSGPRRVAGERVLELVEPGRHQRRDRHEEAQPGGGHPVEAAEQSGRDRRARAGDAGDQGDACTSPMTIASRRRQLALGPRPAWPLARPAT